MRFTRRRRGGVKAELSDVEAGILTDLAHQLLSLLGEPAPPQDPLAALVGMPSGDIQPPDDPVLARLLPAAYADDPQAALEFRRYTDADLRDGKRANVQRVLQTLPAAGGRLELDRDSCDAWLSWLNAIRLALGTALEVTEDDLPHDDPSHQVYGWLGWLQESLLSCLDPRLG